MVIVSVEMEDMLFCISDIPQYMVELYVRQELVDSFIYEGTLTDCLLFCIDVGTDYNTSITNIWVNEKTR